MKIFATASIFFLCLEAAALALLSILPFGFGLQWPTLLPISSAVLFTAILLSLAYASVFLGSSRPIASILTSLSTFISAALLYKLTNWISYAS